MLSEHSYVNLVMTHNWNLQKAIFSGLLESTGLVPARVYELWNYRDENDDLQLNVRGKIAGDNSFSPGMAAETIEKKCTV